MVAGISSRFGGRIKQFAQVGPNGETLIEYSMNQAISAGFNKIIFIVGDKTEQPFKEKFQSRYQGVPVHYANQTLDPITRNKPWGTCDALCATKHLIDCPFVICNGDDLYGESTLKRLVEHLQGSEEEATTGYTLLDVLPEQGTTNRAIFKVRDGYAQSLDEIFNISRAALDQKNIKPDELCSMNLFALHPSVVDFLDENLKRFKEEHANDRNIECLLPTEISKLIQEEKIKMKIYPATDQWLGVTNPEDEEAIRKKLA